MKLNNIIILLCLISTIARYALDSYLPSLPGIERYFAASSFETQLTLTLYLLGFSVSQIFYGPLSDRYGRKKIITIGLWIFLISSTLSIFTTSITQLIFTRLLAGIGIGAASVLNRAIASDKFRGADFASAWAYTTSTLTFVLILAPLIGGFIQDTFNWQANIIFTTGYVFIILLILYAFLPETNQYTSQYQLKPKKVLNDYLSMFNNKTFIAHIICYTCAFAGLIAYFQLSPFLIIDTLGYTATGYGLLSLYIAASYFFSGILIKKLVYKIGTHLMLITGLIIMAVAGACMLLGYLLDYLNLYVILIPAIMYVVGARIVIPNAMAGSLGEFPQKIGCASALVGCFQMLGSAITSFAISIFYQDDQSTLALTFLILACSALIGFKYLTRREKRYLSPNNQVLHK